MLNSIMKYIEAILDRHTMYQVIITILSAWVGLTFLFTGLGYLPYSFEEIVLAFATIMASATVFHFLLALLTRAPANYGSTIITALIIFFIFNPTAVQVELIGLAAAAGIAVLSKYVLAYRRLHLVNPAAFAAAVAGVGGFGFVSWWIGTPIMAAAVAIGGLLIVLKINRGALVAWAALTMLLAFVVQGAIGGWLTSQEITAFLLSSPLLFFLTVMLTEPLTTPAGTGNQIAYGVGIGLLASISFSIGPFYGSPELALVIGNLIAYPLTMRSRLVLTLNRVREVARNTLEFCFTPNHAFSFSPGQYLEWTLPHQPSDSRGIRRYFTIASAPTEDEVKLTVRTSEEGSSFKKQLQTLEAGGIVYATARSGEFVLPKNPSDHKYLFIAGGIGVTPFVSQLRYLIDTQQPVDGVLFYCNRTQADVAYMDLFAEAAEIGIKTVNVLSQPDADWAGETGFITAEMLERQVPDYKERVAYISGPPTMVRAYTKLLRDSGIPSNKIKTDYFPGLA